jgi:hypothetical protein
MSAFKEGASMTPAPQPKKSKIARSQKIFLEALKKKFSEPIDEPKEVPLNREHITLLAWVRP